MVTTLIFDFDGVITTDEYRGIKNLCPDEKKVENLEIPYYSKSSSTTFWHELRTSFSCANSERDLLNAYNHEDAFQLQYRYAMLDYIRTLSSRFSLYLLSNQIADRAQFLRQHLDLSMFQSAFFSNELGLQKPDIQVFVQVLKIIQKQPAECLFIDDSQGNVIAAQKAGMHSYCFTDLATLKEKITSLRQ